VLGFCYRIKCVFRSSGSSATLAKQANTKGEVVI